MVDIRRATVEDATRLRDFMAELLAENLDTIGRRTVPSVEEEEEFLQKAAASERAFFLIALDRDRIIGMLDLWAGSAPYNRHRAKFGMSVARDWRRMGIGRKLLEAALGEVRQWDGFCRLELECAPWNIAALRLYESAGFRIEGTQEKSLNLRGKPEDGLLMALVW